MIKYIAMTEATSLGEKFKKITKAEEIASLFTLEQKKKLGERYDEKAIATVIGLSPFAHYPATFDKNAFEGIVVAMIRDEIDKEIPTDVVLQFALETGLISELETGRYSPIPEITELVPNLEGVN